MSRIKNFRRRRKASKILQKLPSYHCRHPPPHTQIFPVSSGETWASFGAAWTGQGTRHKISWKWWKKKPLSLAMYLPLNRKLQPLTSTSACRTRRRAEEPPLFFPHLKLLTSGHFGFLDYLCFSTDKVFNCSYP